MSKERVALLQHLGAEVVLTPGILMGHAIARAAQLLEEIPGSIMLGERPPSTSSGTPRTRKESGRSTAATAVPRRYASGVTAIGLPRRRMLEMIRVDHGLRDGDRSHGRRDLGR